MRDKLTVQQGSGMAICHRDNNPQGSQKLGIFLITFSLKEMVRVLSNDSESSGDLR